MDRNYGISLIRVVSMLMIIMCHLSDYYGFCAAAQVFNVGVYVFFLISGWLYSDKNINAPLNWFVKRAKKICIPMYIWVAITLLYGVILGRGRLYGYDVIVYIFNIQGITWIFRDMPAMIPEDSMLSGCGYLWFTTVIMLCYLLFLIFRRWNMKFKNSSWIVAFVIFGVTSFVHIDISYFICFFWGCWLKRKLPVQGMKRYLLLCVISGVAMISRLAGRNYFDGSWFYDIFLVDITHIIIATLVFYTVLLAERKHKIVKLISRNEVTRIADAFSYYIYITHRWFLGNNFGLKYTQMGGHN